MALPGRYIVYMPTVDHIGVSRKIGTDEERQRLKRTLHQLRAESGAPGGFIVRTAANGCTIDELREDMSYLIRTWTDIRRRADRVMRRQSPTAISIWCSESCATSSRPISPPSAWTAN